MRALAGVIAVSGVLLLGMSSPERLQSPEGSERAGSASVRGTRAQAVDSKTSPGTFAQAAESGSGAEPASPFSPQRAFEDLEELVDIGPRVSGTRGNERARRAIRARLEKMGAELREDRFTVAARDGEPVEVVQVTGILPGDSEDVLLLAAHYDTHPFDGFRFVGANDGASGVALVLELGRVLASRPRAYTVWLVFVDGDALVREDEPEPKLLGSRAFAGKLGSSGQLERVRVAIFFDLVADPDLTVVRDLRSNRVYREIFWEQAELRGHRDAFPPDESFGEPITGHRAFLDQGLRRVVAIVDDRFGGRVPPGVYWHTRDDDAEHASPRSLGVVGDVSVATIEEISRRLEKIDRFASPGTAPPGL